MWAKASILGSTHMSRSMLLHIRQVRPKGLVPWQMNPLELILEQRAQLRGNPVMGDQQAKVVCKRDQVSIEQPVRSCRERDPVLDNVGTAGLDRPDMSSLRFGLPASIDHLEPGNGTGVFVRVTDLPSKACIANLSIHQDLLDSSLQANSNRGRSESPGPPRYSPCCPHRGAALGTLSSRRPIFQRWPDSCLESGIARRCRRHSLTPSSYRTRPSCASDVARPTSAPPSSSRKRRAPRC